MLGRAIKDFAKRDDLVIATKLGGRMRDEPTGQARRAKAILREVDDSLRRLGTEYVDLYQIHLWDNETPIEETLNALNVVRTGKVRYLGVSNTAAWQFCKALYIAGERGWSGFVSMQTYLNLLFLKEEREMLPLCADRGVGVIAWSEQGKADRARTDHVFRILYDHTKGTHPVAAAVEM